MSHPFGDLLGQYLHRRHGVSQAKLAEGILQDPSIIGKMCKGQRLHGQQARERVLAIIGWLHTQDLLGTIAEADALLDAAGMAGLREREPAEAVLARLLRSKSPKPVLRPVSHHQSTNLPAPLTSFVGREQEMAEIERLIAEHRLVTLTGAGGVGKTRLAVEFGLKLSRATHSSAAWQDGIWLVELASLTDSSLVAQTIARVFKLSEQASGSLLDTLIVYLGDKHLLLILDNCEHVIDTCTEVAERLLQRCWSVSVLATSREALDIPGEVTYLVPSLAVPDFPLSMLQLSEHILGYEAVRLFVDRARAARGGFDLSTNDSNEIVQICRQLDGIPLALELAAPLTRSIALIDIVVQLGRQLSLLTNMHRTAIPRHKTMHSALAWSYELLSPAELRLLARLSVFAGGWTLDAAQTICADDHEIPSLLGQLIHKSLVITESREGTTRYRLLEPIRQFADEQLITLTEKDAVRAHHSAHYYALAQEAGKTWDTPQQNVTLDRLEPERDNLRAALRWALDHEQAEFALSMNAALFTFWNYRSSMREAIDWLEASLAMPCDDDTPTMIGARAMALSTTGFVAVQIPHFERAKSCMEESLALYEKIDDKRGIAFALRGCGWVAMIRGDLELAVPYVEQSVALCTEIGDLWGMAWSAFDSGYLAFVRSDWTQAETLLEDALTKMHEQGIVFGAYRALIALGHVKRLQMQLAQATTYYREALTLHQHSHFIQITSDVLEGMGQIAVATTQPARAATLFAAALAVREKYGHKRWQHLEDNYQHAVAAARTQLEQDAWVAPWDFGRALSLEEAVAYALAK